MNRCVRPRTSVSAHEGSVLLMVRPHSEVIAIRINKVNAAPTRKIESRPADKALCIYDFLFRTFQVDAVEDY